jgi:hypothetical protein
MVNHCDCQRCEEALSRAEKAEEEVERLRRLCKDRPYLGACDDDVGDGFFAWLDKIDAEGDKAEGRGEGEKLCTRDK